MSCIERAQDLRAGVANAVNKMVVRLLHERMPQDLLKLAVLPPLDAAANAQAQSIANYVAKRMQVS